MLREVPDFNPLMSPETSSQALRRGHEKNVKPHEFSKGPALMRERDTLY